MGLLEACECCGGRMTRGLPVAVLRVLEAVLRAHRQAERGRMVLGQLGWSSCEARRQTCGQRRILGQEVRLWCGVLWERTLGLLGSVARWDPRRNTDVRRVLGKLWMLEVLEERG